MKRLTILALLTCLVSCAPAVEAPSRPEGDAGDVRDPSLIYEGEAPDSIIGGDLTYHPDGSTGDDEEVKWHATSACEHAGWNGTTVILEVMSEREWAAPGLDQCNNGYAKTPWNYEVRVIANAAGPPIPRDLTTVYMDFDWTTFPENGDFALATLREDVGEWFWMAWVPLKVDGLPTGVAHDNGGLKPSTDLPKTFGELVVALQSAKSVCDYDRWGWPDLVRDPTNFQKQCRPGYVQPDVGDPYADY